MITLAEVLKEACKTKGMTQTELSKRAGITESAISHYLKGDRIPHIKQFYKICIILDLDCNDVLTWCYGGTEI